MFHRTLKLWISAALLAASICTPALTLADPDSDETQKVLEKSLSVVEIDREIAKIEQQQQQLEQSIEENTSRLQIQEHDIVTAKQQAGERIRAYYMGEREDLLGSLLSVKNFHDFLTVVDYISLIFERDQEIIGTYQQAYTKLKQNKQQLDKMSADLVKTKTDLQSEKARVVALQEEVDRSVASSKDPEKLKQMIDELGTFWNDVGLAEVRKYFKALDQAMKDFPDYVEQYNGSLATNGLNYTLTIKEENLNAFLRSKNALFNNFSFHFQSDQVIAEGQEGDLKLRLEGHYTVTDNPKNAIIFHVDKLVFNGLTLPDTTAKELEQDFDLGFYPQQMMPFIKATSVELEPQLMTVKLKLAL
ncbi:coiled-coil domain-containing protein [Paenibacillus physcomitrellae]|uniref:N-terminal domain of peptidoglycan hydrolase CwlO-containing protein n=1 Tax=Paenibacillus physcomitrellae TaxID=1619311 RepID=A0ABQ1FMT2_9BACL|nr:hypothetical protein [Paenibacillus physcomitrellae]GGA20701.1 hypothetical protein GCM10010917_01750 [Paenibacillus physcomitrellae]